MSFITFLVVLMFSSCGKEPQGGDDAKIDVQLEIPATISLSEGMMEANFRIMFNKAPLATDKIVFEGAQKHTCSIVVSERSVKVAFPAAIETGEYKVYLQRGSARKLLGETSINVITDDLKLDPQTTVYGTVSCDGAPLKGVVVSDGFEVVATDDKGMYQLKSKKEHKYVFISVPGGYEVKTDGVFPQIHKQLKASASSLESVDFDLIKVEGQDNHTMIMMGDMHLANRNNDLKQFARFTDEINGFISANSGKKVYGLTLGDMTWDLYWTSNAYDFTNYRNTINYIKGMPIFHCIGNHDHEMNAVGDFETVAKFKELMAPTYYSFNIGKVHYIVIDDIDCTNDGTGSRTYVERIVNEQVEWLKKDLKYVAKDTPVVIAMHVPFNGIKNRNDVLGIISSYSDVHFVTGHTHKVTNYEKDGYFEHVSGAVCADWWWSGKNNETLLCSTDGAPGGYAVWDIAGKDFKWRYKATGRPDDYQFRSYDLNNVAFTTANMTTDIKEEHLSAYIKAYPESKANEVLINVWNWNNGWKIKVTDENGNVLDTKHESAYDPLHIAARFSWVSKTTSNFETQKNGDFFRVRASDADVDLTITVEDEFGNVYTEKMVRPKAFNKETYR